MATPQINQQLQALAQAKSRELLARARQVLSRYSNSGDLVNSLQAKVEGTGQDARIILSFAEHGGLIDKKKMVWGKVPEIRKMEKWVQRKGVDAFRYISGIGNARNLTDEQKVKRIASGVAWSYRLHQSNWKRKQWRRQTLVDLLKDLNEKTARIWENEIVITLEHALETGQ